MTETEPPLDYDATQVGQNGWRQGSIASRDFVEELSHPDVSSLAADALAVVLSHDCDVVSASFEKEPLVELVWIAPVDNPNGQLTLGKNARRLHLALDHGNEGKRWFEARACDRFTISRRHLLSSGPLPEWSLAGDGKRMIASWVARRYERSAFPDEFNGRLPKKAKLTRKLELGGTWIEHLYVALSEEELPSEQPYELLLRAVMKVEDFEDARKREQADRCLQELAGLLHGAKGIEVRDAELVSEADVTLDDLRWMKRWGDFDWLSAPEPQE